MILSFTVVVHTADLRATTNKIGSAMNESLSSILVTCARANTSYSSRFIAVMLVIILSGCSFGHQAYRTGQNGTQLAQGTREFDLHFVEADDEGWFWEPEQAKSALSAVRHAAAASDTLVVIFVHGWHHNAACCDENLEGFKEVLRRLRTEVNQPMYKSARGRGQVQEGFPRPINIIGIYVGWRGRSLPGQIDYATFWGRKSAAKRVGESDFQEFMIRLQNVYDDHGPREPFLGLVSIGHSFGGAAMLAATSKFFESELQKFNVEPVFLRSSSNGRPPSLAQPLHGFGDLVLLVNPAVEAAAYERLNLLARGLQYNSTQTPLLVTFSADNDQPRRRFFEWGRIAGEWFTGAPHFDDDRERSMRRTALGVYGDGGEQLTHRLEPIDLGVRLEHSQRVSEPEGLCLPKMKQCYYEWYRWNQSPKVSAADSLDVSDTSIGQLQKISRFDFSRELVFSNLRFAPNRPQAVPYQPMIVASVDPRVIDGHNGMFSEPFMDFLIRYIGFIEAKKYLLKASPQ